MAILPGWTSLVAAGSIAHSLHIAAMVVLALVVVAEGMALVYDDRKYALIGVAERDITGRRDLKQREAEERQHNEIAELQRRLEETQRQQASRRLTITDQQTLIAALSPFPDSRSTSLPYLETLKGSSLRANSFQSRYRPDGTRRASTRLRSPPILSA
jgi:hypothetical protein